MHPKHKALSLSLNFFDIKTKKHYTIKGFDGTTAKACEYIFAEAKKNHNDKNPFIIFLIDNTKAGNIIDTAQVDMKFLLKKAFNRQARMTIKTMGEKHHAWLEGLPNDTAAPAIQVAEKI